MKHSNKTALIKVLSKLAPNRRVPSDVLVELDTLFAHVLSHECGVDEYSFLESIRQNRHARKNDGKREEDNKRHNS